MSRDLRGMSTVSARQKNRKREAKFPNHWTVMLLLSHCISVHTQHSSSCLRSCRRVVQLVITWTLKNLALWWWCCCCRRHRVIRDVRTASELVVIRSSIAADTPQCCFLPKRLFVLRCNQGILQCGRALQRLTS